MKTLIKYNLFLVSLIFFFTPTQEVKSQDFGADVVSSYVWRGAEYGTGLACLLYTSPSPRDRG